jgi:hypothetical protein
VRLYGSGFGSDPAALSISVAGAPCHVLQLDESGIVCRIQRIDGSSRPVAPYPGERGLKWEWAVPGETATHAMVLTGGAATPGIAFKLPESEAISFLRLSEPTLSTTLSSYKASLAIDGITAVSKNMAHSSGSSETNPWLSVRVEPAFSLNQVDVHNRYDCCWDRLSPFEVWVADRPGDPRNNPNATKCGSYTTTIPLTTSLGPYSISCDGLQGSHVTLLLPGTKRIINIAEVKVIDALCPRLARPPPPCLVHSLVHSLIYSLHTRSIFQKHILEATCS